MQVKALWSLREKIPEALVRDGVTYKVRRASLAFTVLIANTVFPRVVPAGTIDFNYWIDATSIRGRPLFEGGFYFFHSRGNSDHHVYKCV